MGISDKYVRKVKVSCASLRSYTVELRREVIDEAFDKILKKIKILVNIEGVLIRGEYKGSILMLSPKGRIAIIKGPEEEKIKEFLDDLFS
ncbi:MAG: hypothetical protein DRJ38_01485 [Thermoprotei archaeon]|nr:MAG: hypothetical protein DRJ38_01485 [Thermoprotei archaeon]